MTSGRKVALVTGAGRGIGLGIAKSLAGDGCGIAVCDIHEAGAVEGALGEIRACGVEVMYCRADVCDASARKVMIEDIKKKFGRLDVLVNNAGVAPKVRASVLEATEESFERLMKINLQGPYFLTQLVANWMIEQRKSVSCFEGCIINISSISAEVASFTRGDYCISKAGVSMATKLWAAALGEHGIPVYEIRPGIIATDMTSTVKEKYDKLIAGGLLINPRWGVPEDIGKAAAALVRGDMPYSTGQVIMVDGGLSVQRL